MPDAHNGHPKMGGGAPEFGGAQGLPPLSPCHGGLPKAREDAAERHA